MISLGAIPLTVGTFNIAHFGYQRGFGHQGLAAAVEFILDCTPVPPDILALPEATNCLLDGQYALRRTLVWPLASRLRAGWYEPMVASRGLPGRGNSHHLLLLNTQRVRPLGWYDPSLLMGHSQRMAGFIEARVDGHDVLVCCEHWSGGDGRGVFWRSANRVRTHGGYQAKTLLLGDFNATSSWEKEYLPDWEALCEKRDELHKLQQKGWFNPATSRWEMDTRQLDSLLHRIEPRGGYFDMGQEAGDPTPTTHPDEGSGLRIDRVLYSVGFPGEVVEYQVRQPDLSVSDHAYVYGSFALTPAPSATAT